MMKIILAEGSRQCGDCQLCCRLLPVRPLDKKAGQRCVFQKFHKGCTVYGTPKMPPDCSTWSCRWVVSNDTADLPRPDRCGYVLDIMPDYVTMVDNATGASRHIQVVQIWIDPKRPHAHRDPALRAYLVRRSEEGIIGIVRYDTQKAMTIFPPLLSSDGQWHEHWSGVRQKQHSIIDILQALGEKHEPETSEESVR